MTESRPSRWIALGATLLGVTFVAGCGGQEDVASKPRPAANVTISAAVARGRIELSPTKVGGGPITLSVANLSSKTVEVKIDPADSGSGRASTGPISPQGTASVALTVNPGAYTVSASGGNRSATLAVGPPRKSAQNQLLQP